MRRNENGGAQELGAILQTIIGRRASKRSSRSRSISEAWRCAVGPAAAEQAEVTAFRLGVLEVTVTSAALHHELSGFRKRELLATLNAKLPDVELRDIRFKQG